MPKTEQAFNLAMGQFGQKAIPGASSNPIILKYFQDAGHPEILDDDIPWCAAFLNAMLERARLPTTGSLAARSFLQWGQPTTAPVLGDVAVFWRESPGSGLGHVGFVCAVFKDYVYILGGNQDNQVEIKPFLTSQLLGYRRLT